jgi:glycosyltransferase involved in cell wall biosynthesis
MPEPPHQEVAMPERRPRVSVGLPVYNGAEFVTEAIESVLAQDFADLELIIGDNASTDATPEICRRYLGTDRRVSYLRSEVNRGAAWNFSRLPDVARGEYFKWASSDDVCAPTFLSRCVEVLDHHADVVLCSTGTVMIDERGQAIGPLEITNHGTVGEPAERFRDLLLRPHKAFPVFGLIRRDALCETPRLGAYTASDLVTLADLALRGRFHEVPEPLFFNRDHGGRSIRANPTYKARQPWFDPERAEKITLPRWRLGIEYARAIGRVPLSSAQRRQAFAVLARWGWANGLSLGNDIARATRDAGLLATKTAIQPRKTPKRGD